MNRKISIIALALLLSISSLASAAVDKVTGSGWFSPAASTYKARFYVDVTKDGANPPTGIVKYKARAKKGPVVKVRGGGHIIPETSTTHQATFAIKVTKKDDNPPTGEIEYHFARTRLNIKSTGITELLLSDTGRPPS